MNKIGYILSVIHPKFNLSLFVFFFGGYALCVDVNAVPGFEPDVAPKKPTSRKDSKPFYTLIKLLGEEASPSIGNTLQRV